MITTALITLIHQGSFTSAFTTSTSRWSSPACSSATRATPGRARALTRARSSPTSRSSGRETSSPVAICRALRVLGARARPRLGPLELELGTRSTAGPEKSGR